MIEASVTECTIDLVGAQGYRWIIFVNILDRGRLGSMVQGDPGKGKQLFVVAVVTPGEFADIAIEINRGMSSENFTKNIDPDGV